MTVCTSPRCLRASLPLHTVTDAARAPLEAAVRSAQPTALGERAAVVGPGAAPEPSATPAPSGPADPQVRSRDHLRDREHLEHTVAHVADPVPVSHRTAPATSDGTSATVVIALDDGQRFEIRGLVLVGRNPQPRDGEAVDLLVPVNDLSRSVSKTHAALRWDGRRLWVVDRGSTNGTVVLTGHEQQPVGTDAEVPVEPGTRIGIGDRTLVVEPVAPTPGGAR